MKGNELRKALIAGCKSNLNERLRRAYTIGSKSSLNKWLAAKQMGVAANG